MVGRSRRSHASVSRRPLEWSAMPTPSIRRRINALEKIVALSRTPDYPPLTASEIDGIARRLQRDEMLTRVDLDRLERRSPILQGELLMTCHRGQVHVKRYIGIDLAGVEDSDATAGPSPAQATRGGECRHP